MISGLKIGNFKAFSETQYIPIRPLTLIFGPNSSGKSSLIHAIALAYQAIESGDLDVFKTKVGGEAIDLGGFRQYVYRRNTDLDVEWAVEFDVSKLSGKLAELLAPVKVVAITLIFGLHKVEVEVKETADEEIEEAKSLYKPDEEKPLAKKVDEADESEEEGKLTDEEFKEVIDLIRRDIPFIRICEITGDGKRILRMSRRKGGVYRLDELDPDHPVPKEIFNAIAAFYTTAITLNEGDYDAFKGAISELLDELTIQIDRFLPRHVLKKGAPLESRPPLLAAISKGTRKEDLTNATKIVFPMVLNDLIQGIGEMIEKEIKRFQYLGPLRSYPPRHIAFSQHEDINWFAGGGYAWDIVRNNYSIRKMVNAWLTDKDKLSTPYRLVVRHLLTIDDLDKRYTAIIQQIEDQFVTHEDHDLDLFGELYGALERLKISEANISNVQEINLVDQRTNTLVSHRDVGIGISQVLPVLVSAYASKEKIIAIEQPEIHLHPALQAELGDVLIESALGQRKNTLIIESHSEHLLLRIMRRMRETTSGKLPEGVPPVHPEDVMVLFVEPDGSRSIVREMPLNERGELVKAWPGGFFEEDFKELF